MIKLNKDSWWSGFYRWWWTEELPKDFCTYFWKSFLIFPLIGLTICLGLLVGLSPIAVVVTHLELFGVINLLDEPFPVSGWIVIISSWVLLLMYGWAFLSESENYENLRELFKAYKDKYCPVIQWS